MNGRQIAKNSRSIGSLLSKPKSKIDSLKLNGYSMYTGKFENIKKVGK